MNTLKDVYMKYWDDYLINIRRNPNVLAANPFLIVEPKDYYNKDKRVMICGQETQGWGNEFDNDPEKATIDELFRIYKEFVNDDGGYNSPYWHFIKKLKIECPNVGFVCNNIVKIGKREGAGCNDSINELALKYFPVIPEEISILKPDLIVFITGPNYDWRIRKALGEFQILPENQIRRFNQIVFSNKELPTSYRCYHPAYQRRIGQVDLVVSRLIDMINKL